MYNYRFARTYRAMMFFDFLDHIYFLLTTIVLPSLNTNIRTSAPPPQLSIIVTENTIVTAIQRTVLFV